MTELLNGDCLKELEKIEAGSIDLILTDPPYGTMNGAELDGWESQTTKWDTAIEPNKIFNLANRVLRKNGKIILFSQEPYTSKLINNVIPNIPFSYRMIWEKDHFANSLIAKKAPVSYCEDILVFSKKNPVHDCEFVHPLRPYFRKVMEFIGLNLKQINTKLKHRKAEHTFYVDSTQFGLCTEKTYDELINTFNIDEMGGFKLYEELKKIDFAFNLAFSSVFNLWEGNKYKSNILKYKKDYDGYHPTQKPVLLLEDLIKTYSNEGDTVLDFTMGSGSTGVACVNTNRNFIGIELNKGYFDIAKERIKKAGGICDG